MGHLTNVWSALASLYSLLRDLRAEGELPAHYKEGDAWCLEEEGFELEGSYPSMRRRVRNIDKRIPVRNCEKIRGLTES
jgi:hypothetical protein